MSLNKTLLLMAIGLATGCSNQAHQAALAAERAATNPPDVDRGDVIGAATSSAFSNAITRHTDAANNIVCYTVRNGNGGHNISCVRTL